MSVFQPLADHAEDGFAIAEKDLELRGPGDFFGRMPGDRLGAGKEELVVRV